MFVRCTKPTGDWYKYSLILPAVSIGNVGQLAVDLLLSTLDVTRVGYWYDASTLALVGNNPFPKSSEEVKEQCCLVTGVEVYECKVHRLVIMQQRVPLVRQRKNDFLRNLTKWIKKENFRQVIMLSSSAAHERNDSQIKGSPFRCLSSDALDKDISLGETFGWQKLESRVFPSPSAVDLPESSGISVLSIPGGGITKMFYEKCCEEGFSVAILLLFCSEGDNIPEALTLVTYLNEWLNLVQVYPNQHSFTEWQIPYSWHLMFGSPHAPL